jgi:hypothetical protein
LFGEAHVCVLAIVAAERRYRIPAGLLKAIGDVESGRPSADGRTIEPWPWTTNAEGRGSYFDSLSQATAWVKRQQLAGIESIDVGCLQVNLLWHPKAFASLAEAFDPFTNADYAARFLVSLFNATGDWTTAVGSYHSQTIAVAKPYRERVQADFQGRSTTHCLTRQAALQLSWNATMPHDNATIFAPTRDPTLEWHPLPTEQVLARTSQARERWMFERRDNRRCIADPS